MNAVYPGVVLENRYRVLQALGKGGLSQTFDIDDQGIAKVLKVLNLAQFPHLEGRQKAVTLFQREAEVLSRLRCPGVPRVEPDGYFVLENALPEPIYCLVMEKIAGMDLGQWLTTQATTPLSQEQAIAWLKQLVQILDRLHQEGLIHRDIKPSNIMLQPDGQLVLIDFGGVREVTETYLQNVTGTGVISPGYTPPEQAEGKAVLQSDFFALGRTFIHLLTRNHPLDFDRDSRTGNLLWHTSVPHLSPSLVKLLDYLMALLPGRRPQTAELILRYLDDIAIDTTAIAPTRETPNQSFPRHPPKAPSLGQSPLLRQIVAVLRPTQTPKNPWEKAALRRTLTGHTDAVSTIAISPDNQLLVSGSHDATINLWSLRSKELIGTLFGHGDRITSLAISPNGQLLASSSHDQTIKLWSLVKAELWYTLTAHQHRINDVTFSPDGRMLISSSAKETNVWSVKTGKLLRSLAIQRTDPVRAIACSPDGRICVVGCLSGNLELWNPHIGQRIGSFPALTGGVNSITFSPNGRFLASSIGRTVQVYNATSGQPLHTLDCVQDGSLCVNFSPDSQILASGGDRAITLWHPATGQRLNTLLGHIGTVRSVAFSPDGSLLASGSQDRTIKLWLPVP